jgi:two-component system, NarL family, response regulator LiaR
MAAMSVRLAIIDDYEVVVRGLANMLTSSSDQFTIVELDSGTRVEEDVDIALYDTFAQAQGDGPAVAELVASPHVGKVVVYSWNVQQRLVDAALQRGVAGYVSKSLGGAELADALSRIHAGEVVVPAVHEEEESGVAGGNWPGREEGLTPREAEIIALITQGLSNQEIADKTCLSINSVKSYIRTGYRKMGVTSRTNAVLWGLEHGFAPDRVRVKDPDHT